MFIVINKCYGGFQLPQEFCSMHGLSCYALIERTDPRLVEFVQSHGGKVVDAWSTLVTVEIPDTATDWVLNEYDGMESVIYVLDGKIRYA